jgi:hypothetical protein
VTARTLGAPAAAVLVLFLMAWAGVTEQAAGFANAAVVLYYWLTLGFVAFRLCTLIARTARTAAPADHGPAVHGPPVHGDGTGPRSDPEPHRHCPNRTPP